MNKFIVLACLDLNDVRTIKNISEMEVESASTIDDLVKEQLKREAIESQPSANKYEGNVVALACTSDPSLVLFFPVSPDVVEKMNEAIGSENQLDIGTFGIYKTMVDSWSATDKYLSGIIIDVIYDKEMDDDIMDVKLVLSDTNNGCINSLVSIDFINAIFLSILERMNILLSDALLSKLMPVFEEQVESENDIGNIDKVDDGVSEDKKEILDIVKQIMGGQVKNHNEKEELKKPKISKAPKASKTSKTIKTTKKSKTKKSKNEKK